MKYSIGTFQNAIVDLSRQLSHAQHHYDQVEQKIGPRLSALDEESKSAILARYLAKSEAKLIRCQKELAKTKELLMKTTRSFQSHDEFFDKGEEWNSDGENALRLSGMFEALNENDQVDDWNNAEQVLNGEIAQVSDSSSPQIVL